MNRADWKVKPNDTSLTFCNCTENTTTKKTKSMVHYQEKTFNKMKKTISLQKKEYRASVLYLMLGASEYSLTSRIHAIQSGSALYSFEIGTWQLESWYSHVCLSLILVCSGSICVHIEESSSGGYIYLNSNAIFFHQSFWLDYKQRKLFILYLCVCI